MLPFCTWYYTLEWASKLMWKHHVLGVTSKNYVWLTTQSVRVSICCYFMGVNCHKFYSTNIFFDPYHMSKLFRSINISNLYFLFRLPSGFPFLYFSLLLFFFFFLFPHCLNLKIIIFLLIHLRSFFVHKIIKNNNFLLVL